MLVYILVAGGLFKLLADYLWQVGCHYIKVLADTPEISIANYVKTFLGPRERYIKHIWLF